MNASDRTGFECAVSREVLSRCGREDQPLVLLYTLDQSKLRRMRSLSNSASLQSRQC